MERPSQSLSRGSRSGGAGMEVFISCFSRCLTEPQINCILFGLHTEIILCSYRKGRKGAASYFGLICGAASHQGTERAWMQWYSRQGWYLPSGNIYALTNREWGSSSLRSRDKGDDSAKGHQTHKHISWTRDPLCSLPSPPSIQQGPRPSPVPMGFPTCSLPRP